MIYEFRTYQAAEGKLDALNRRFDELTWPIMQRIGFEQVGFWLAEDTNQLMYMLKWPDHERAKAAWKTFQSDPEWQRGKQASEADGPLLVKTSSQFLTSTHYSAAP